MRANELSPIYMPKSEDEDVHDLKRSKHQFKSFLLRNFINYGGSANW